MKLEIELSDETFDSIVKSSISQDVTVAACATDMLECVTGTTENVPDVKRAAPDVIPNKINPWDPEDYRLVVEVTGDFCIKRDGGFKACNGMQGYLVKLGKKDAVVMFGDYKCYIPVDNLRYVNSSRNIQHDAELIKTPHWEGVE